MILDLTTTFAGDPLFNAFLPITDNKHFSKIIECGTSFHVNYFKRLTTYHSVNSFFIGGRNQQRHIAHYLSCCLEPIGTTHFRI